MDLIFDFIYHFAGFKVWKLYGLLFNGNKRSGSLINLQDRKRGKPHVKCGNTLFSWWIDIVKPTDSLCFLLSLCWVAWCFFTLNFLTFSIFGESYVFLSCAVTLYNWNKTWMMWKMQILMEMMCERLNSKWRKRQWKRNENMHVNRVTIGYRPHFKFLEFKCRLNIYHNNSIYLIKKLLAGVVNCYNYDRP